MPPALLRLGQYLLIVAMFAACGGHWVVLQSVAWGGMIVEYARTAELAVAVARTFDGQHPCGLCTQIETGKKNEQKPDAPVLAGKLDFYQAATTALVGPVLPVWWLSLGDVAAEGRGERPSVPPPRRA